MCGICGKFSPAGVQREEVQRMAQVIAHRGPDDRGFYIDGRIGLGNRRLSIIDVEGGHQPICNEDETIWVVFNGEIYNYPQLRQELRRNGHVFRTQSDTEVIVHLYEELGERCVERLQGMFAFAIWDKTQQKLILARDHLGQKPLFYAKDGESFLFASEIKGVLAAIKDQPEIDFESVHHYLSLRFIPPPNTMMQQIKKLPPAHLLVLQNGIISISRYWDISFKEKLKLSEADFLVELKEKLTQTVAKHLVSDVPVGAFLSGGMDSSMVVALMAQEIGGAFNTFSIGVSEQDFNELPFARSVAEYHNTSHIEACVQADLIQNLPKMIWHLDEPSDPIAACQYQAAALAAEHVKVVLGGDGGDELFAGFDRYIGVGYVDYYARIPGIIRRQLIGAILERIPENFSYKSSSQKIRWMQQLSMLPTVGERYAEATCFFRFNHQQKQAMYGQWLRNKVGHIRSADIIVEQFNGAPADDPIDRMLYADYKTRLPEHSLMLTDRMTMAHGLELRSPFLDHHLVEFMAKFPSNIKIRKRELKYVLRKLGADYLPKQILHREKQGFMFPIAYWFRGDLYPFVKRFLVDSPLVEEGLIRRDAMVQLVDDHHHNRVDNHVRIWMLLNLSLWYQMYIRGEEPAILSERLKRNLTPE